MNSFQATDFDGREKIYVLAEFPYPSGTGLHLGHVFTFTGADVYARYQRMRGKNVLFPMGWDAFGLPTENFAIRTGRSPQEVTSENTKAFKQQMQALGFSFDWSREVDTTDPNYYRWTQWIFIQLFKHGLAFKQEMPINWCPNCKIGLANEEVVDGRCERCGTGTERRRISQWVVKITAYADRLLAGLEQTQFIDKVKAAQVNWIGRSEGAEIHFTLVGSPQEMESAGERAGERAHEQGLNEVKVFTTRPDTLWGCTFLVLAPEHPLVVRARAQPEVERYLDGALRKSDLERADPGGEKTGVYSGLSAIHPATGERLPIWISDFVLPSYGAGAIMGVPAHDERDHAFAKRYHLPIRPVIAPTGALKSAPVGAPSGSFSGSPVGAPSGAPEGAPSSLSADIQDDPRSGLVLAGWDFSAAAYTGLTGSMVNSGPLDGLAPRQAILAAVDWLEGQAHGARAVSYHLRDWIFSRQHYWGEPIPMIFCENCGWTPVPEADLPVRLPVVERYQPSDTGESPLANIPEWVNVPCPACAGLGRRETDTMPNWAGSDWYFLRYTDPDNSERLADLEKLRYWLPVDVYIGGDEHNTLHLLYSRFIYQFLYDIGVAPPEDPEPYRKRLSHGVILGLDGARMSKSRGNVILPDELVARYGADVLRTYLMFMGPFDATMAWNQRTMQGVRRFLERFERFVASSLLSGLPAQGGREAAAEELPPMIHRLIQGVTGDLEAFKFNTAVAKLMEGLNWAAASARLPGEKELQVWIRLLAPFAPFTAEALWKRSGASGSVHSAAWPAYDPELAREELLEIPVQVNGKLRATLMIRRDEPEAEVTARAAALEPVKRYLSAGEVSKVVYIQDRTVNFVVSSRK
jgi:leucyl-tRNA synthetase